MPTVIESTAQYGYGNPNSVTNHAPLMATIGATVGQASTDSSQYRVLSLPGTVDANPQAVLTTPVSTPNPGLAYDYTIAVTWVAGSITALLYILGWVSAGATYTATLSAAGIHQVAGGYVTASGMITPDVNTAVTLQIGVVTGAATSTVIAACTVSRVL